MEFIKTMRKREFIEMTLKTIASIFAVFIAIILMEGMIYSIQLNALTTKASTNVMNSTSTIAYCFEQKEDEYIVICYNPGATNDGASSDWSCNPNSKYTKEQCENLSVKEVIFRTPNAFELVMTPIHYVIIAVLVLGVGGFFTYKFIRLGKEYNKIEEEFKKTGTIEIANQ